MLTAKSCFFITFPKKNKLFLGKSVDKTQELQKGYVKKSEEQQKIQELAEKYEEELANRYIAVYDKLDLVTVMDNPKIMKEMQTEKVGSLEKRAVKRAYRRIIEKFVKGIEEKQTEKKEKATKGSKKEAQFLCNECGCEFPINLKECPVCGEEVDSIFIERI